MANPRTMIAAALAAATLLSGSAAWATAAAKHGLHKPAVHATATTAPKRS